MTPEEEPGQLIAGVIIWMALAFAAGYSTHALHARTPLTPPPWSAKP